MEEECRNKDRSHWTSKIYQNTALLGGDIYIAALDYDTHDLLTDVIHWNK